MIFAVISLENISRDLRNIEIFFQEVNIKEPFISILYLSKKVFKIKYLDNFNSKFKFNDLGK